MFGLKGYRVYHGHAVVGETEDTKCVRSVMHAYTRVTSSNHYRFAPSRRRHRARTSPFGLKRPILARTAQARKLSRRRSEEGLGPFRAQPPSHCSCHDSHSVMYCARCMWSSYMIGSGAAGASRCSNSIAQKPLNQLVRKLLASNIPVVPSHFVPALLLFREAKPPVPSSSRSISVREGRVFLRSDVRMTIATHVPPGLPSDVAFLHRALTNTC